MRGLSAHKLFLGSCSLVSRSGDWLRVSASLRLLPVVEGRFKPRPKKSPCLGPVPCGGQRGVPGKPRAFGEKRFSTPFPWLAVSKLPSEEDGCVCFASVSAPSPAGDGVSSGESSASLRFGDDPSRRGPPSKSAPHAQQPFAQDDVMRFFVKDSARLCVGARSLPGSSEELSRRRGALCILRVCGECMHASLCRSGSPLQSFSPEFVSRASSRRSPPPPLALFGGWSWVC